MTHPTINALYYGCWKDVGHYFWSPGMKRVSWAYEIGLVPWGNVDCCLCPGYIDQYRRGYEQQSVAALHVKDGYTALAMWDRTVDRRPASNSVFLFRGERDFEYMCFWSRAVFPEVWRRINDAALVTLVDTLKDETNGR